jgi:hypothetical protein
MRAWLALAAAAAVLAPLLAGCSSAPPPQPVVEVVPGQTLTVSEAPKPSKGTVSGIVGDDALYPLKGATITILSLNLSATTTAGGQFAIVNVPEGIYIVEGSLKDHATVQTTVEVEAGKVARAVLLLARLPPSDPYHTTFKAETFIEFQVADAGFVGDGNQSLTFTLDPSKRMTLVGESTWSGIETTDPTPLQFHLQGLDLHDILVGDEPNPFSVHLDPRILPPGPDEFRFGVGPKPFSPIVLVQSRGTIFMSVFYNEAAPDGWTMLDS